MFGAARPTSCAAVNVTAIIYSFVVLIALKREDPDARFKLPLKAVVLGEFAIIAVLLGWHLVRVMMFLVAACSECGARGSQLYNRNLALCTALRHVYESGMRLDFNLLLLVRPGARFKKALRTNALAQLPLLLALPPPVPACASREGCARPWSGPAGALRQPARPGRGAEQGALARLPELRHAAAPGTVRQGAATAVGVCLATPAAGAAKATAEQQSIWQHLRRCRVVF